MTCQWHDCDAPPRFTVRVLTKTRQDCDEYTDARYCVLHAWKMRKMRYRPRRLAEVRAS